MSDDIGYIPGFDDEIYEDNYYDFITKNLYDSEQKRTIKTMKKLARIDKRLSNLGDMGHEKYLKLDSNIQELLKWYTREERAYFKQDDPLWKDTIFNLGKGLLNFNPIGAIYNAAVQYGKGFNTVLNVGMQVAENSANPLDTDLWANSYFNQEALYNTELDKNLEKKHGKLKAFIAKQYLAGYNPAEIITNHSKGFSQEFVNLITDFEQNKSQWENGILEDYRQAKISIGRYAARKLVGIRGESETGFGLGGFKFGSPMAASKEAEKIRTGEVKISQEEKDLMFTRVSGFTDFVAQIFLDPLTYVTFGAGKGVSLMGVPVTETAKVIKLSGKGTKGVRKAFDISPKLRETWDGFGGLIKRYADAKTMDEKARVREEIRILYPQLSDDASIEFNVLNKVYNASQAKKVYGDANNVSKILSGNVDGTDFFRESIFVHRGRRQISNGARRLWYKLGSQDYQNVNDVEKFIDELAVYGSDDVVGKKIDTPEMFAINQERQKWLKKFTTVLSRSPGDQPIQLGANAVKTANTVRFLFRIISSRNIADIATQHFIRVSAAEQVMILRGLYRAIMESSGVPEGKIREILSEKFSSIEKGFGPNPENINPWTGAINSYSGPAIERDLSRTIGNLPWSVIQDSAGNAALLSGGKTGSFGKAKDNKFRLLNLLGGVVNNSLTSTGTRVWSLLTLAPKLGIRSAIDEAFFLSITAPGHVLKQYFAARKASAIATAATGDVKSVGAISLMVRKALSKVTGIKNINPVALLDNNVRANVRQKVYNDALKYGWTFEQTMAVLNHSFAYEAIQRMGTRGLNPDQVNYVYQLLTNNPTFLESAASSVARATATGGVIDNTSRIGALDNPALAKMVEDHSVELSRTYNIIDAKELSETEMAVNQFAFLNRWFYQNKLSKADLGEIFIKNNGLKTEDDFVKAVDEVMQNIDPKDIPKIINDRANLSFNISNKGLPEEQAIRQMVEYSFSQMYFVFHGSKNSISRNGKFNQKLFEHFVNSGSNGQALKIEFDDYFDLAKDNIIENSIRSNIAKVDDFDGGIENWFAKGEEALWKLMDRTVTDLFRQKSVMMWYLAKRNEGKVLEADLLFENFSSLTTNAFSRSDFEKIKANPSAYSSEINRDLQRATTLTEKVMVEKSLHEAVNMVLKYVDNPHVRTYLASSTKNINRFYRAIEDFYRRIYRLKNVSSKVLYRMRLMNTGLNNVGITYTNENGEEYFFIPLDDVLFSAINPFLTLMSGGSLSMMQPKFNNYTGNVVGLNPSFQDSAGIPYLSGPIAGISALGLKAIAGRVFETSPWVEEIDNVLLGDIGNDIDVYKAVTPVLVQKLFKVLDLEDQKRLYNSSILQAIAFNAAYSGLDHPGMKPNATAEEMQDYLDIVRIGAHNNQVFNAILGTILPMSTSTQESMNLDDHWRNTGTTSIRTPFFELYEAIVNKWGDDVADPWELAKAIYIGKNPKKLIYTVSREQKEIKPLLKKTEEVQDWLITNKKFVEKYGEASYLFAPQTEGKINPSVYNWMEAAGLVSNKDVLKYLRSINVSELKKTYFDLADNLDEELSKTAGYEERKYLINKTTTQRKYLLTAFPLLKDEIEEEDFTVTRERKMLRSLEEIHKDLKSPLTMQQRSLLGKVLNIFNTGYAQMSIDAGYSTQISLIKKEARFKTEEALTKIAGTDPFLTQLNNLVFFTLIKNKVRDSDRSTPLG